MLVRASIEGHGAGDLRVLAVLVTWFSVHAARVDADRLTRLPRNRRCAWRSAAPAWSRLTTEVYAHLAPEDLRAEVDRLSRPLQRREAGLPEAAPEKEKAGTEGDQATELCARGELAHVRVLNVIRIPSGALGTLQLPLAPGREQETEYRLD